MDVRPVRGVPPDGGTTATCSDAARRLAEHDRAARALGIRVLQAGAGTSVLTMPVGPGGCNGHGIGHGGLTFLLADTAMAYSALRPDGSAAVTTQASTSFTAPVREGDVLTARSRRVHSHGRHEVHDVEVTRADGTVVALVRGTMVHRDGR